MISVRVSWFLLKFKYANIEGSKWEIETVESILRIVISGHIKYQYEETIQFTKICDSCELKISPPPPTTGNIN